MSVGHSSQFEHLPEGRQGMMFSSSSRLNGIGSGLHDEGQDPTATWWEQEWTAEGSGGRGNRRQQEPSESARVDALETLVRQLIEQNEHLRNEMAEGRSRSSSDLADQGLRGFLRSGISSIHLLALRRGTPKVRRLCLRAHRRPFGMWCMMSRHCPLSFGMFPV